MMLLKASNQITNTNFLSFRVQTVDCGEEVSAWLSQFLGKPCCLIRQSPSFARDMKMGTGKGTALSIAHHINHYIMTGADLLYVLVEMLWRSCVDSLPAKLFNIKTVHKGHIGCSSSHVENKWSKQTNVKNIPYNTKIIILPKY